MVYSLIKNCYDSRWLYLLAYEAGKGLWETSFSAAPKTVTTVIGCTGIRGRKGLSETSFSAVSKTVTTVAGCIYWRTRLERVSRRLRSQLYQRLLRLSLAVSTGVGGWKGCLGDFVLSCIKDCQSVAVSTGIGLRGWEESFGDFVLSCMKD